MNNLFKHLKTIHIHRKAVRSSCFKMGIIWQGLIHDLSKYSITELKIAKYYDGTRSPHQVSRETIGYSASWMHHYHKNKHHFQYWWDEDEVGNIIPTKMPFKYVVESVCDMIGAGKAYMKDKWTPGAPWKYYETKCRGQRLMNKYSCYLLEKLLWNLKEMNDENHFYNWYKNNKKYLEEQYNKNKVEY